MPHTIRTLPFESYGSPCEEVGRWAGWGDVCDYRQGSGWHFDLLGWLPQWLRCLPIGVLGKWLRFQYQSCAFLSYPIHAVLLSRSTARGDGNYRGAESGAAQSRGSLFLIARKDSGSVQGPDPGGAETGGEVGRAWVPDYPKMVPGLFGFGKFRFRIVREYLKYYLK